MNNTIAAPTGHLPLFDNGQQEDDGTYPRESHTLTSNGSIRPPLHPPDPRSPGHQGEGRTKITIPGGYFALLQSSNNRIACNSENALMTEISSRHLPFPGPQSMSLVTLTRRPLLSFHSPSDVRANSAESYTFQQQNHSVPHDGNTPKPIHPALSVNLTRQARGLFRIFG